MAAPAPDAAVEEKVESAFGDEVLAKRDVNTEVVFKVHLVNEEEGIDVVIDCFEEEYLLDAAERQAVDLPASCRNGGCYVCAGKLLEGEMELGDQYVLEDDHIEAGFRLLCCSWVTSDAKIVTHQNDEVT
ncbi:MAG: 2Fe-2S iron-sulfur cluster binding domain-containing protein [Proteobacteria bacterium]|nr:2Fe-2S iron-sulfur cluster binding domain-containing protein [Pseudomonadota bacterium]MCP4921438.1 2Fe-2S iron-sulfur cluster binding domain-containing protein [Pseudomonadota bacterium]